MKVLIRIHSHRAYDKFKKLSIDYKAKYTFDQGYFYEVSDKDIDRALIITGINKARKLKSELLNCWK
ncbi:hypothetical protein LCGC14_1095670 [marine sediment metagenome]|uniref:Uncharacterized protein n=1 Tax=marine sediment metagenome TaxID=412755 RepID=A0A0F9MYV1_9ZZZZ